MSVMGRSHVPGLEDELRSLGFVRAAPNRYRRRTVDLALRRGWITLTAPASMTKRPSASPRPAGSNLAIADDGSFVGSVSGGCVESAVIQTAAEIIAAGGQRLLEFGVSDEEAWDVGLACGGQIEVLLERVE